MSADTESQTGGCLCGAIRYRFDGEPAAAGLCHCRLCQKATGGPVFAATKVTRDQFRVTKGETRTFPSSERGIRHFCGNCGTSLFFEPVDQPEFWEVLLPTLDNPQSIRPSYHIWTDSALSWLPIDDQLPRFAKHRDRGTD